MMRNGHSQSSISSLSTSLPLQQQTLLPPAMAIRLFPATIAAALCFFLHLSSGRNPERDSLLSFRKSLQNQEILSSLPERESGLSSRSLRGTSVTVSLSHLDLSIILYNFCKSRGKTQ
ncbi:unnamed protein product [Cuscuta epithymum]|uniref:Uncharacterized protein n=1 Tax=Cuscuta epithymum TaxID=186058 RepID=A0AAV0EW04_9ASTE|nr:unnamed protein product [Cuscuta epithymum]